MNLRPRDISKEMHEHLRYQPNTTADRVFETLLKRDPHILNWNQQNQHEMYTSPNSIEFATRSFLKTNLSPKGQKQGGNEEYTGDNARVA